MEQAGIRNYFRTQVDNVSEKRELRKLYTAMQVKQSLEDKRSTNIKYWLVT